MNETETRKAVSEAYAAAITKTETSCCATSCCGGKTERAAEKIGYSADDLAGLPENLAESSFGCGNPLAFAEVKPGQTVLDLGSGAGLDLLVAAKAVGPEGRVIGVDMTDEMIAVARRNIAAAGVDNVEVRKGIIEQLPVEDSSVDWVISNCVINLSPEKDRVFSEIARVLKPGGTMQVSDIVAEEMPPELRERVDLFTSCIAGAIPEGEYLAGIERAGLTDVRVTAKMPYTEEALLAFVQSDELPASAAPDGPLGAEDAHAIAKALAGKIASIKVTGRKS